MANLDDPIDFRCAELKLDILKLIYPGVGRNLQAIEGDILTNRLIKEVNDLWGCVSDIKNKGKQEETDV